jgi:hypothetical protein
MFFIVFGVILVLQSGLYSEDGVVTSEDEGLFPDDSTATVLDSAGLDLSYVDTLYNSPEWWYRQVENNSWGVGERLEFIVRYGPIKAGSAVMEVEKIVDCGGRDTYHVFSTAKSSAFFSLFFKVDDKVESYIDTQGIYSCRFEKHIREGGFKDDKATNFDQINHLAITGKDTIKTYPFVQDMLSAFYYARTQDLEVGKPLFIDNHTDRKNYPIEVKVHRRQRVKTRAGTFNCLLLEPVLRTAAIFENKGRLLVWVTDDRFKMPVMMKSKVIIGSITTELVWYRLTG